MADENANISVVLSFLLGTMVGSNWPKIKESLAPLLQSLGEMGGSSYSDITKFMAERKEAIEDQIAASQIKKTKKSTV